MDGVVDCWIDGLVRSDDVSVAVPTVRKVTLNVLVPEESVALAGKVALLSEELMATRSAAVVTRFQFASTALTVTLKAVPAVRAVGVPVLPVGVPGTAVSPGASSWSLVNEPGLTVMLALVLAVRPEAVAVMVRVPAVLKVRLDKALVPDERVMLPVAPPLSSAIAALLSVVVMVTLFVAGPATFQLASTALTTMPLAMAVPAV